ncbi:MAG: DUF3134 domain-containing protein [Kaiparowitsia implicata GSE-PSE-MK54-09C]|jgi:hypothetical protein|nr:DUF3134 domain-containing protein [Kaiparowitsia implicata GSE-PSE-MK54-09C]
MYNPAIRQQPRSQPATVIAPQENASILAWLESSGRLLAREPGDPDFRENEEEISALMSGEESDYDDDDDSMDLDD